MALSYDACVYIFYDHLTIFIGDKPGQFSQTLRRAYRNHTVVVQSSCNLHDLAQKTHDALAMSLRAPYDYLKSLQSFFGPK